MAKKQKRVVVSVTKPKSGQTGYACVEIYDLTKAEEKAIKDSVGKVKQWLESVVGCALTDIQEIYDLDSDGNPIVYDNEDEE